MAHTNSDPSSAFIAAARAYTSLIEGAGRWRRTDRFLAEAYRRLSVLLPLALSLADPDIDDEDDADSARDTFDAERWWDRYHVLHRLLGEHDVFREVFNPRTDEAAITGTLANGLTQIWSELREGLDHIDAGRSPAVAIWGWRWNFWTSWGHHATDALRLVTVDFDGDTWPG